MQSVPPHPAPNLQAQESVWTTSPLLLAIQHEFCGDFFFFAVLLPSVIPKPPLMPTVRRFSIAWKLLLFLTPSPGQLSILTLNPLSLFLSLSFVLPYFEGWFTFLGIWGPLPVFSYFVEVALHAEELWCICGRESDLPVLFLLHLGSTLEKISYA